MEHVFLSKGIPVVPSLGEFVAHFYEHFDEQRTSHQATMIYGVSVSNVEHVTICLITHIAHVRHQILQTPFTDLSYLPTRIHYLLV
jgi:hypothetical protein